MTHAFSEYLPHFAVHPRRRATDLSPGIQPLAGADAPPADGPAEAEARGRREALAEARAEFEAIRANDLAEFESRLAAREREFVEGTADAIAAEMTAGLKRIEQTVSDHVAAVLSRFLEGAVRTRAVAELGESVAALLVSAGAARVRFTGPELLIARLRERFAGYGDVTFVAADRADVSVTIDDTVIETQIAAWEERLQRAIAAEEGR